MAHFRLSAFGQHAHPSILSATTGPSIHQTGLQVNVTTVAGTSTSPLPSVRDVGAMSSPRHHLPNHGPSAQTHRDIGQPTAPSGKWLRYVINVVWGAVYAKRPRFGCGCGVRVQVRYLCHLASGLCETTCLGGRYSETVKGGIICAVFCLIISTKWPRLARWHCEWMEGCV
jgi:hypothetical protein